MSEYITLSSFGSEGVFMGRTKILTSCLPKSMQSASYYGDTLDEKTIARELGKAISTHRKNALEYKRLKEIYLGKQAILDREQGDRKVNNKVVVNYAEPITRDIVGFTYGNGIEYSARRTEKVSLVEELNNMVSVENKDAINKAFGDGQSIGGRYYIAVMPDSLETNGVPFEFVDLDPERTEVVYSAYNRNVPVFAWTENTAVKGGNDVIVYTVWTNERIYVLRGNEKRGLRVISQTFSVLNQTQTLPYKPNPLGLIPIVEYQNNEFCRGDWESIVPLFDAANSLTSDRVNDVEQIVESILCIFGVDPDGIDDLDKNKKSFALVFSGAPGITQDAKFIVNPLDGESVSKLTSYFESVIKFIAGIPERDASTGSDTGIAAEVRTGSGDLEIVAKNKCTYTKMAERRVLKLILSICHNKGLLKELDDSDVDIKIPYSRYYDVQNMAQAMQILDSMGLDENDTASAVKWPSDRTGMISRWKARKIKEEQKNVENQKPAGEVDTGNGGNRTDDSAGGQDGGNSSSRPGTE